MMDHRKSRKKPRQYSICTSGISFHWLNWWIDYNTEA
ncbi:unnamed protein product [Brugia timori]|uniref:Uncharacterized protein n=1 Tax=Brugia timori TaxID=42155 RepID=A0A0R3Q7Q1_9BILA|nr:unnamed protein product [Brugia timori]